MTTRQIPAKQGLAEVTKDVELWLATHPVNIYTIIEIAYMQGRRDCGGEPCS